MAIYNYKVLYEKYNWGGVKSTSKNKKNRTINTNYADMFYYDDEAIKKAHDLIIKNFKTLINKLNKNKDFQDKLRSILSKTDYFDKNKNRALPKLVCNVDDKYFKQYEFGITFINGDESWEDDNTYWNISKIVIKDHIEEILNDEVGLTWKNTSYREESDGNETKPGYVHFVFAANKKPTNESTEVTNEGKIGKWIGNWYKEKIKEQQEKNKQQLEEWWSYKKDVKDNLQSAMKETIEECKNDKSFMSKYHKAVDKYVESILDYCDGDKDDDMVSDAEACRDDADDSLSLYCKGTSKNKVVMILFEFNNPDFLNEFISPVVNDIINRFKNKDSIKEYFKSGEVKITDKDPGYGYLEFYIK